VFPYPLSKPGLSASALPARLTCLTITTTSAVSRRRGVIGDDYWQAGGLCACRQPIQQAFQKPLCPTPRAPAQPSQWLDCSALTTAPGGEALPLPARKKTITANPRNAHSDLTAFATLTPFSTFTVLSKVPKKFA